MLSIPSNITNQRVLAICLDGFEPSVAATLIENGELPMLAKLQNSGARFQLDHGNALRTGLAGEHLATGMSPDLAARWAAVHFDPENYKVWQEGTRLKPFTAALDCRCVIFDPTYFDLQQAPDTQGLVGWGAHDPGVPTTANPESIVSEIEKRFGCYPAAQWIYGTPWHSVNATKKMADRLIESVDLRAEVAQWLLTDRLPDWDLAIVTVSEAHSAIEALWHGIDPTHPLHQSPSASSAADGVIGVYKRIDRLLAKLVQAIPDAAIVLFSMHGMGPNRSDAASFLLLPELLYRSEFNQALFHSIDKKTCPTINNCVALSETDNWNSWVRRGFEIESRRPWSRITRRLKALIPRTESQLPELGPNMQRLDWMPATRYQQYWPAMKAFAIPSFYDGRVRLNLESRETAGKVSVSEYLQTVDKIVDLVSACKNPATGESVVEDVEVCDRTNPRDLDPTESDIVFIWKGAPMAFLHPQFGQIGPVPYRRTGGHTGDSGFACIAAAGVPAGDYGSRSSFDVVPTLIELTNARVESTLETSGRSLLKAIC